MMTDQDLDVRLAALLARPEPAADPVFAERIVALARHDLALRRARRRAVERVGLEALALSAIVAAFAMLARSGTEFAGFGDEIALSNPAMLGLAMLGLWGLVGLRPTPAR